MYDEEMGLKSSLGESAVRGNSVKITRSFHPKGSVRWGSRDKGRGSGEGPETMLCPARRCVQGITHKVSEDTRTCPH